MEKFDIPDIIKKAEIGTFTAEPIGEEDGIVFYYFFLRRGFVGWFLGASYAYAYKDGEIVRKYRGKEADDLADRLAPERMKRYEKEIEWESVAKDDLDEIQDWFMMEGLPIGEAAVQRLLDGDGTEDDERRLREAIMNGKADKVRWNGGRIVVE